MPGIMLEDPQDSGPGGCSAFGGGANGSADSGEPLQVGGGGVCNRRAEASSWSRRWMKGMAEGKRGLKTHFTLR